MIVRISRSKIREPLRQPIKTPLSTSNKKSQLTPPDPQSKRIVPSGKATDDVNFPHYENKFADFPSSLANSVNQIVKGRSSTHTERPIHSFGGGESDSTNQRGGGEKDLGAAGRKLSGHLGKVRASVSLEIG